MTLASAPHALGELFGSLLQYDLAAVEERKPEVIGYRPAEHRLMRERHDERVHGLQRANRDKPKVDGSQDEATVSKLTLALTDARYAPRNERLRDDESAIEARVDERLDVKLIVRILQVA